MHGFLNVFAGAALAFNLNLDRDTLVEILEDESPDSFTFHDRELGWKDYRIKSGDRIKVMRLDTHEFIRRFLIHVLPDCFHRIRHYGLLSSAARKTNIAKVRALLGAEAVKREDAPTAETIALTLREPCPECGGTMRIVETFRRGETPRSRAPPRKQAA